MFRLFCWVFAVLLFCERVCSGSFVGYLLCFCVSVCVPVVLLFCWVFVVLLCERVCSGCFVGYLLCFCVSVCVPVVLLGICCAICVSVCVPVVLLGICCASV